MNGRRTKEFSQRTISSTRRTKTTTRRAYENSRRRNTILRRAKKSARRRKNISRRRKDLSALRKNGLVGVGERAETAILFEQRRPPACILCARVAHRRTWMIVFPLIR